MELIVRHDGVNWTAEGGGLTFEAETLASLDDLVRRGVSKDIEQGNSVEVMMSFDNSVIPQWMRQYSQHYFNRIIIVEGRRSL